MDRRLDPSRAPGTLAVMRRTRVPSLGFLVFVLGCSGNDRPPSTDAGALSDRGTFTDELFDAAPDVPVFTGDASVEVIRYDYALELSTRAATARLSLRVSSPGDCVTLGFRPAEASEVSLGGVSPREITVADGRLRACDGRHRGWARGDTLELSVHFTLPLEALRPTQVGYTVRRNSSGGTFSYLLGWIGECSRHGPCDTRTDRFASYHFAVDHPEGTRVFCPGRITTTKARTECDFDLPGGPTYSTFGLIAGQGWTEVPIGRFGGVTVTLYDTPNTGITGALDRRAVEGFLGFMARNFGPYPYGDAMRMVVAPTYWAGFEHPGNIVLADSLARGRLFHTVLHEIAHQWAGDQTTVSTVRDFVWKEAMAEYLTYVYEAETQAPEVSRTSAAIWKDTALRATAFPVPTEDRALVEYYGAAYGAGTMILFRQMEVIFGRPRVMAALRTLLGRPRSIGVEDLRRALEESTGALLSGYFDAWLRGRGAPSWPVVTITRSPLVDGSLTLSARVESADGVARGGRFSVRLLGAEGQSVDVPFDMGLDGAAPAPVTVRPGFEVTREVLDPLSEALVYPPQGGGSLVNTPVLEPWMAPR